MRKKILIVDDEVFISEQLNLVLIDLNYIITGMAHNTKSAIKSLKLNPPDLAILDIKMQGNNKGFEIARYIKDNMDIPFVFLTSFADTSTVKEASSLEPDGYLLKPFNTNDIFTSLEIILNKPRKERQSIIVKSGHSKVKIFAEDILWIKSDGAYIEIHTQSQRLVLRDTIDNFILDHKLNFFNRAHRSYVVNLEHVQKVTSQNLTINGNIVPISRKFRTDILKYFDNN